VWLDVVAKVAQAVDVASEGARRHPEAVGQLGAGPEAVDLQQRQQLEGAASGVAGSIGHVPSLPHIAVRIWPQWFLP
jgi:hypothetical protein